MSELLQSLFSWSLAASALGLLGVWFSRWLRKRTRAGRIEKAMSRYHDLERETRASRLREGVSRDKEREIDQTLSRIREEIVAIEKGDSYAKMDAKQLADEFNRLSERFSSGGK